MKPIARQSILTTLSSYLGVVIGYFNVLWLLPYALEPEQIGIFRTIQDMALLFVPFAQLGVGNGITRFYPKVKSSQFSFFTLSLLLSLFGFLVVAVLFFFFKDTLISAFATNSPEVIDFFGVVLFITLFSVLNTILDAFCRSFLKVAVPAFFREVILRLLVAILIASYLLRWVSFDIFMWGLALTYFIALLGMIIYMIRVDLFKLNFQFSDFPVGFLKEFINYNLITLLGTTGAILIMKIDSLMVSSLIGLDANAIYTIAFSIAVVIEMPRRAISQVIMPVVAEHFEKNELPEINKLYKQVAVHQLLICLLLFLGIWSSIDSLYHFVPNNQVYEVGKWVVLWIGLGKLSDVLFSINGEIIVFSRYYVFNITATLIMCVAVIILNLVLIPLMGIEGAALASFLAMFLFNFVKYIYVKKRLNFDPFSMDILKIIFLGIITFTIQYYLFQNLELGISNIILRSLVVISVYLGGVFLLDIAKESRESIIKKIKRTGS
ncbi:polysaccharide biosynthesis C-terminal domain-containing protein [Belliella sp. R4-6]|uniref:Polysaccharide biosynthesis C-terminal domain-containing protein n=1 Tax=Belliella alkalica TaxID=1730871 RepID=A0ABS9VCW0_9BACT|nr:polysaccharide biosynthesis C-terminal domain-containing protein [Belliella alkalica]MCH7414274.1 polysaccharide biosynthesis C-terminal domain-containing protein [Belliella alkalica]